MGAGVWKKIKGFFKDVGNGFKHGWNKTVNFFKKVPIIGKIAEKIPKFNNSTNPVTEHFGGDGDIKFVNGKAVRVS